MSPLIELVEKLRRSGEAIFLGCDQNGKEIFAKVRESVALVGPTGRGKTSGVIIPSVACHPGPVIVTSVRGAGRDPDTRTATLSARKLIAQEYGGEVVELSIDDAFGYLAATAWWEITDHCDTWEDAKARAGLISHAGVSASTQSHDFWRRQVANLLAPLLFASHLYSPRLSGEDILTMIQNGQLDPEDVQGLVIRVVLDQLKSEYPGHISLRQLGKFCGTTGDATTKNDTFTVAENALDVLSHERTADDASIDLESFVRSYGTIYITAGRERARQARALIAAFLGAVEDAWNKVPYQDRASSLLLALDDVATIAPIGSLPEGVAMYGGSGIQLLLGFQHSSLAKEPWGEGGEAVIKGTNHLMIFPGLNDEKLTAPFEGFSSKVSRHHWEVSVVENFRSGPKFVDATWLIEERERLEAIQDGARPGTAGPLIKAELYRLQSKRLRQVKTNRYGPKIEDLYKEIYGLTRRVPRAQLRPTLDHSDIFSGREGCVFVQSGNALRFLQLTKYFEDKEWRRRLQ